MNTQQNAFFFEIQQIPEDSKIFDELQNQQVYFFYFQVNQKYYLFFYQQKSIDIDRIEPLIHILNELDRKQRKIRSLRGFFLYVLEIMENGQDYQILKTNLQPSFWRKLKSILRQNKKIVLLQFLFGTTETKIDIEEKIQILETQVDSLQQKIIQLEQNQRLNFKDALRGTLDAPDATKIIQQSDCVRKESSLANDSKVNLEARHPILESLSEDSLDRLLNNQQYNIPSNLEKSLHGSNFTTLGKISEEERIEIIQKGFDVFLKKQWHQ